MSYPKKTANFYDRPVLLCDIVQKGPIAIEQEWEEIAFVSSVFVYRTGFLKSPTFQEGARGRAGDIIEGRAQDVAFENLEYEQEGCPCNEGSGGRRGRGRHLVVGGGLCNATCLTESLSILYYVVAQRFLS